MIITFKSLWLLNLLDWRHLDALASLVDRRMNVRDLGWLALLGDSALLALVTCLAVVSRSGVAVRLVFFKPVIEGCWLFFAALCRWSQTWCQRLFLLLLNQCLVKGSVQSLVLFVFDQDQRTPAPLSDVAG